VKGELKGGKMRLGKIDNTRIGDREKRESSGHQQQQSQSPELKCEERQMSAGLKRGRARAEDERIRQAGRLHMHLLAEMKI